MFTCDYKKLRLSFNEFHDVAPDDMPEYDEFCLLELKDGRHTAGKWHPDDPVKGKPVSGRFGRGTADTVDLDEVSKWHSLERYDLTSCLEDAEIDYIDLGPEKDGARSFLIGGFKSLKDKDYPKSEQYCLLILNNGGLAAGRWDQWPKKQGGTFIYASALASHSMKEVWAWTPLSSDTFFELEEERERERLHEEELNRNPSTDPELFRYGTDIRVYYRKALAKLKKEYPWATVTQMKKKTPYVIVPLHGRYVFGQDNGTMLDVRMIDEWTDGTTADEFIDFLCEYTREAVRNAAPETKFRYGLDIEVYREKAFANVKRDYRWLERPMIETNWHYAIRRVKGDWEFVREYGKKNDYTVVDCENAERFLEILENDYRNDALRANPAVDVYAVPFGTIEIHGWYLEHYIFSKLRTGDYKVSVQAGDRVTGGSREFFITPYCFEAETYEEFLDRYLEIVPGDSFGLSKEDLLPNEDLKAFLGY